MLVTRSIGIPLLVPAMWRMLCQGGCSRELACQAHPLLGKSYDAQARVVDPLTQAGKAVVIPSLRTRKHQRD